MSMRTTLTSNSYHLKYDWFISSYSFRFITLENIILIILINTSSDSNHLSKFTIWLIVAFTTKEKRHISKKDRAACRAYTQSFTKYANHTYFVIRVYVELRRLKINNIIRVVKYQCNEYFKHWIWVE